MRADGRPSLGRNNEKLLDTAGNVITYQEITNEDGEIEQVYLDSDGNTFTGELKYHDDYYFHEAAKRLAASYKRTVNYGASIENFVPKEYGIDKEFNFIEINDIKGRVWNMTGKQEWIDSMDGSAISSHIFSILCG